MCIRDRFKAVYILFWTFILNAICKAGYKEVSWFMVLLPIILLFIIIGIVILNSGSARLFEGFKEGLEGDDTEEVAQQEVAEKLEEMEERLAAKEKELAAKVKAVKQCEDARVAVRAAGAMARDAKIENQSMAR